MKSSRSLVLILGATFACGCGGPEWSGTFAGTLLASAQCSDGDRPSQEAPAEWTVTEADDGSLEVAFGASGNPCGPLLADPTAEAGVAVLRPQVCPVQMAGGDRQEGRRLGGSLNLRENQLEAELRFEQKVTYSDGFQVECNGTSRGTLLRLVRE